MKVLLFNGAGESSLSKSTTGSRLVATLSQILTNRGLEPVAFNVAESSVPLFEASLFADPPAAVWQMADVFVQTELQIWLAPMYHGSMPGIMKNALDWLEVTSSNKKPYLTDKITGMICWADGGHAMQGVNAMDNVAKALRSWVLPYAIPIVKRDLFDNATGDVSDVYRLKMEKMVEMMMHAHQLLIPSI